MSVHQFSAEWCSAAAGRIAKLEKQLAAAEAAARWCWDNLSCETVHHTHKQHHEYNEPCPVLQGALKRWPFLGESANEGGERCGVYSA